MKSRGFTLVETLITGSLVATVVGLTLSFLVPSFRSGSRTAMRLEMQQQASLALDRLVIDLERSAAASVSLLPGQQADQAHGVAMQRLQGFTSSGSQTWEPYLLVYYWLPQTRSLKLEHWRSGQAPALPISLQTGRPSQIARHDLLQIINDGSAPEKTIATGVTSFSVDYPPAPARAPYQLKLTLERTVLRRTAPERLTLTRSLNPRNRW